MIDPTYELTRVADEDSFYKKMCRKRRLYRLVGEVYVGKRAKLEYFKRWLTRISLPSNAQILEAGSGDGVFTYFIAKKFTDASVTGLELNQIEAKVCQRIAAEENINNLRFEVGSLSESRWSSQFDFIFCLDVLEHISDDVTAMKEMFGALKPKGQLLVHVPNRHIMQLSGQLVTVPDEEAWRINPGHVRNGYALEELSSKLESVGFHVKQIEQTQSRPMAYAHSIYRKAEGMLPMRVLILPVINILIRLDMHKKPVHGNTVWALAEKP